MRVGWPGGWTGRAVDPAGLGKAGEGLGGDRRLEGERSVRRMGQDRRQGGLVRWGWARPVRLGKPGWSGEGWAGPVRPRDGAEPVSPADWAGG